MLCPKCGTENKDTGVFCKKCGTNIKEETQIDSLSNVLKEKILIAENLRREILSESQKYENQLENLRDSLQTHEKEVHVIWEEFGKKREEKLKGVESKFHGEKTIMDAEIQQLQGKLSRIRNEIIEIYQKSQKEKMFLEYKKQVKARREITKKKIEIENTRKPQYTIKYQDAFQCFKVRNYQPFLPLRFTRMYLDSLNRDRIYAEAVCYPGEEIRFVTVDIDMEDTKGNIYRMEKCQWELQNVKKDYKAISTNVLTIPDSFLSECKIKNVRIYIDKIDEKEENKLENRNKLSLDLSKEDYTALDGLRKKYNADDAVKEPEITEQYWYCLCGMKNDLHYGKCFICGRENRQ